MPSPASNARSRGLNETRWLPLVPPISRRAGTCSRWSVSSTQAPVALTIIAGSSVRVGLSSPTPGRLAISAVVLRSVVAW